MPYGTQESLPRKPFGGRKKRWATVHRAKHSLPLRDLDWYDSPYGKPMEHFGGTHEDRIGPRTIPATTGRYRDGCPADPVRAARAIGNARTALEVARGLSSRVGLAANQRASVEHELADLEANCRCSVEKQSTQRYDIFGVTSTWAETSLSICCRRLAFL